MKKIKFFSALLSVLMLFSIAACDKKDVPKPKPEQKEGNANEYVNNWIHKQMVVYYYWNEKLPTNPDFTLNPKDFFYSLVNKFDKEANPDGDRFSVIRENYVDLINALGGVTSDEIGFEYILVNVSPKGTAVKQYYLLVLYPKLNTDAYLKGVKRGRFIVKINNQDITEHNYKTLLSGTGNRTLSFADWVYNQESEKYELKRSSKDVTIQMHKEYEESPVYLDSVYTIDDKKIGYLVYNFFATDKGDGTHKYDRGLMKSLENIKSKGATELILDLRYNGGGAVSTAIALASAIVKNRSTNNIIISANYNPIYHSQLQSKYGKNFNKSFFIEKIFNIDQQFVADIPSLNLSRLYVLVSPWTASASELIITGLKPYMDVILIGGKTVGKNVGSFAIYKPEDPKNKWGILPITFKYFNSLGKSDFSTGFVPDYALDEFDKLILQDFGDINELYLSKALEVITGIPMKSPTRSMHVSENAHLKIIKDSESIKARGLYDDRFQINNLELIKN